MQTKLTSDLEATVYDAGGNILGRARVQVDEALPHGPGASERAAAALVQQEFRNQLGALLNSPQISAAFTAAPPPPPSPPQ